MAYTATPSPKVVCPSALSSYSYDGLDDLLYEWFLRENGYTPVQGYNRSDAACVSSNSSDQWRGSSEVLEDRIEAYVMPVIDACMAMLTGDQRLAILIEQRNRMGPAVFRNPRAGEKHAEAYQEAKTAIAVLLRKRGVIWRGDL